MKKAVLAALVLAAAACSGEPSGPPDHPHALPTATATASAAPAAPTPPAFRLPDTVAPLYTAYPPEMNFHLAAALQSPRFNLHNVRYVMTHKSTDMSAIVPTRTLAYEDAAVRV